MAGGKAARLRDERWSSWRRACGTAGSRLEWFVSGLLFLSHLHYSVRHSSLPVDLHAVLPWTAVELTADVVEWSTPFLIFLGLCGHFASRVEKEESKVPLIGWLFFLFTCFFGPSSSEQALFYRLLASGCTLLALIYDERRPFEPMRRQVDEWRNRRSATPAVRQNRALRFRATESPFAHEQSPDLSPILPPGREAADYAEWLDEDLDDDAVQLPDLNGEREKKRTPARELTPFSELSFRLDGLSLSGGNKQPVDLFTSLSGQTANPFGSKKTTTNPVKPFELRVSQPQWPRPMFSRFAACSTPVDGSPASVPSSDGLRLRSDRPTAALLSPNRVPSFRQLPPPPSASRRLLRKLTRLVATVSVFVFLLFVGCFCYHLCYVLKDSRSSLATVEE